MLMANEYGSAFKTVRNREEMQELLASGWKVVEDEANQKEKKTAKEESAIEAPVVTKTGKNELMYNDRYLSQWAQVGTRKELIEIFDYFGIERTSNTTRNDLVIRLRQYIREVKAEQRREKNDGN